LLHTESGARWIFARAQTASNGALQAERLNGDLKSGLTIRRLTFSTDSMTLEIVETRLVVNLDLLPLQVQISDASIENTTIQVGASGEVSQNKNLRAIVEGLSLPLTVVFADVSADQITVSGLTPENDVVLTQATLAGRWHDEIIIERLAVSTLDGLVELQASLGLISPFKATVSGQLENVPVFAAYLEPMDIQLHGEGNLDELSINVSSTPIEISLQGSIANILDSLSWNLQAELVELTLEVGENDTEVRIVEGSAASTGSLNNYSLTAAAMIDTLDIEPFESIVTGKGTMNGFEFSELILRNTGSDLTGAGRIGWGEDWSIEAGLNVAKLDLNSFFSDWPADQPLHGELSLQLDKEYLAVSDSYFVAGDTDMSVRADAEIDLAASVVAGALRWENALWPVGQGEARVSSKSGNIAVVGSLDDWRIDGGVDIGAPSVPSGHFLIDGRGDSDHVDIKIIESEVLGGNIFGHAAFNWRGRQEWSAGLDMSSVDIGSLVDGWPGYVSGRVDGSGQMSPFELDLGLSSINGELRDRPLSANGRIMFAENRFAATELAILHDDTRVALNGDLFARSGLRFDVSVNDVTMYVGEADGAFTAAGVVSLHAEHPSLRMNGNSAVLGFGEIQAAGIEIVNGSGDNRVIDAEIRIEQLDVHGNIIENVAVGLVVDDVAQSLQFDGSHRNTNVHFLVAGEFDDLRNPSNWKGQLQELDLALEGGLAATISAPTALLLSKNAMTIDQGCVATDAGMRLCAQADWSSDGYLQIGANLSNVPVNLANEFIDTELKFDQLVSGDFEWLQSKDSGTKGNADIIMSAGTIVSVVDPDVTIETETGLLTFDIVNGQLLSGHATLPMPRLGYIEAQFSVPDIAQGKNSAVAGLLDVDLSDVALLAALSPLIDEAHGVLRADLALSGTLSEPRLAGDLSLGNGSLTYLPLGLRLDHIDMTSLLHDSGQIELSGKFQAGDGRGEILTRPGYTTTVTKGFELELRGTNMTLIDVPDVQMRADLDIRVGYDYKALTLDGRVLIPHARVTPSNLTITRDSESEDVVIVAGELPDNQLRPSRERDMRIAGSLEVVFGDDVLVDLGLATTNVTGSTVFSWMDGLIPVADGRYNLAGSVRAFGQVLEITEGGLRFPKVPANNPFIRIRAEREIYGNSQVKSAGVLISGTIKQPSVEAYTNPRTTEERALALLVTGSEFDFEQGVGAIDFGTYIAPRVFVSYGLGLFETENVIRVRYDLKRGFGITATSGEKETGVDLSYRIER
jgi:translocation and assembly module TamB